MKIVIAGAGVAGRGAGAAGRGAGAGACCASAYDAATTASTIVADSVAETFLAVRAFTDMFR